MPLGRKDTETVGLTKCCFCVSRAELSTTCAERDALGGAYTYAA